MGRERVGKKQHMPAKSHQKRELFHTFRVFYTFAPLRLLQNAGMLLAWHACLGPEPTPIMLPVAALPNAAQHTGRMRKRQRAEGASTGNLFAILFQPGDGQAPCPDGLGGVAQQSAMLFIRARR
jgi:hypothetical protein